MTSGNYSTDISEDLLVTKLLPFSFILFPFRSASSRPNDAVGW